MQGEIRMTEICARILALLRRRFGSCGQSKDKSFRQQVVAFRGDFSGDRGGQA
jgi:hypothetical protein